MNRGRKVATPASKSIRAIFTALRWIAAVGMLGMGAVDFAAETPPPSDFRLAKLEAFFRSYRCPAPDHAEEYVKTADLHHIDYRLLPAISFLESTCGVSQRLNNYWGWDSAQTGFASFESGLEYVARSLASGSGYKGKSLDQKLHLYNPNPIYAVEVKKVMREISRQQPARAGSFVTEDLD